MMLAKLAYLFGSGGFCAASLLLAQDKMDVVERYGLLGLHAVVVIGIGGGMLKIGWEQVKTSREIRAVLSSLVRSVKHEAEENDEERDDAVDEVKRTILEARDHVVGHLKAAFHRPR